MYGYGRPMCVRTLPDTTHMYIVVKAWGETVVLSKPKHDWVTRITKYLCTIQTTVIDQSRCDIAV